MSDMNKGIRLDIWRLASLPTGLSLNSGVQATAFFRSRNLLFNSSYSSPSSLGFLSVTATKLLDEY